MSHVNVKAWMSGDPISIDASASAYEALCAMSDHRIRHLPVLDEARRVVGVLSFDDLRAALVGPISVADLPGPEVREEALEWRVGELMSDAPLVTSAEEGLSSAADRMADARVGCLPVVDAAGRLVGMLSETDALRALAAAAWPRD